MILPAVSVPDARDYDPRLGALMCSGQPARDAAFGIAGGLMVAADIETPSISDSFTIKCVTFAWVWEGTTISVVLDPSRDDRDAAACREMFGRAGHLVFHNGSFDVPPLVRRGLALRSHIEKVLDLIVYARMAWPDELTRKDLGSIAKRVLPRTPSVDEGLKLAMKAAGMRSKDEWYSKGDVDMPYYRSNAMADTIVTLRALEPSMRAAVDRQLDHPFGDRGLTHRGDAESLVFREQIMNRWGLARATDGFDVDIPYADRYRDSVDEEMNRAAAALREYGVSPGNGGQLLVKLDELGEVPPDWPRTEKTNRLSSAKEHMKDLGDHPLALAHKTFAHSEKMLGYLDTVVARSRVTGRLHPQINILGASQTGRMSISEPALQQFPGDARPIILADPGRSLSSIDWSSIEPGLLGWMSNDYEFMAPFENGADIYLPIMHMAGIVRDVAKPVFLGDMYGLGTRKLARNLKTDPDTAKRYKDQMHAAMPVAARHMTKIKMIAARYATAITLSGRVLTVPRFKGEVAAYKAVNFTFQGSCYDLIANVVVEATRQGFAHLIYVPMHDEITCDEQIADEVEYLMRRPVPEFGRWCNWTPRLRTDRAPLGACWRKPD